jgi:Transport and Golgi organisation 2
MCSLVILFRPGHDWPILLASNRDEMLDRPWQPPARHWPDRQEVIAGRDELAGGSWLGLNEAGLVAGVLNRWQSLGPQAGKRSRGELVLDALDFADAADAVAMLADLDPMAYRTFNMVVADNSHAFWLRNPGRKIEAEPLPPGYSMITAHDRNDLSSLRIRHFLPLWEAAEVPDPDAGTWSAWEALLADHTHAPGGEVFDAMNIVSNTGFGTVSSSLIALPGPHRLDLAPSWRYTVGRPDLHPYLPVKF